MGTKAEDVADVRAALGLPPVPTLRPASQEEVKRLLASTSRRSTTPLRKAFVRNDEPDVDPPLARIVSTRGRGGGVALKLFLGLVRRSSAAPYSTHLSARRWANLLDLDDPAQLGARRVADALKRLEDLGLIEIEARRGEASEVTLLREDGSGGAYEPPSSNARTGQRSNPENWYFQAPDGLWDGYIQKLSAPGLAMLLILLAEPASRADGVWWSVDNFPTWYGVRASMRARGTSELRELGLIRISKMKIDTPRGGNDDDRDRVRNLYVLTGPARTVSQNADIAAKASPGAAARSAQPRRARRRMKRS